MAEKELEENIIDLEQEFLDINISTFGKFFPVKNLEKILKDSIYDYYITESNTWKEEVILEYIKIKIKKIKQQKSFDKEDTIILKLFEIYELMEEAEKNDDDFTTQYLNLSDEKEILLKLFMMIEKRFKDSLDIALDLIIGQSFSDISEE
ncbi:hypothetical protein [Fusobacterium sp.]|uniref:hypothetical protein n=1 Tax=Fusobacterium sp. TaxID=68766 RepID=UPI002904BED9|nr:hypothetical protein [Fusobacterium sp.]MDU1912208.1 hypothetical protein [Fusobacterium sp.]